MHTLPPQTPNKNKKNVYNHHFEVVSFLFWLIKNLIIFFKKYKSTWKEEESIIQVPYK